MAKPRKSTLDEFVDRFCDFPLESQEKALDLMEFEYRQAMRRAAKAIRGKDEDAMENKPAAAEQIPLGERNSG